MAETEYDGRVRVGGPAQRRDLGGNLSMLKVAVGPMDNNAYLLRCERTGDQVLIDAANDADTLLQLIEHNGGQLRRVITTHQHGDHWQALEQIVQATGADTVAHPEDAPGIPVPTTELVSQGDTIGVGLLQLTAIHLVGHTPGSIALHYVPGGSDPAHLWTGDSLFPGGVGNTHGKRENFESLLTDVSRKLFDVLPDDTMVYPGHGADTTIGAERPNLEEWRARGW